MAKPGLNGLPVANLSPENETTATSINDPENDGQEIKIAELNSGVDPGIPELKISLESD